MADDFDPAGIFPRAITMTKVERIGAERFHKVNNALQFAVVVASDGNRFAKSACFRQKFLCGLDGRGIMHEVAQNDQSSRLIIADQTQ